MTSPPTEPADHLSDLDEGIAAAKREADAAAKKALEQQHQAAPKQ